MSTNKHDLRKQLSAACQRNVELNSEITRLKQCEEDRADAAFLRYISSQAAIRASAREAAKDAAREQYEAKQAAQRRREQYEAKQAAQRQRNNVLNSAGVSLSMDVGILLAVAFITLFPDDIYVAFFAAAAQLILTLIITFWRLRK